MTTAAMTAVNPFTHATPMANGTSTGNNSDASAATISSNDFLTLLVTEMKNQDPTAQTDPNQYVNQLVQVNSLEQLIEINGNLSSAGAGGTKAHAVATRISSTHPPGMMSGVNDPSSGGQKGVKGVSSPIPVSANPISTFAGNLGISRPVPAAHRIAQALSGRH